MMDDTTANRKRNHFTMRSIMDYTMGVIYIGVAVVLMLPEKLGLQMENFDQTFRFIFGAICLLYGGWRIYRGYKKEY